MIEKWVAKHVEVRMAGEGPKIVISRVPRPPFKTHLT
jgi:hypothetical protein